jgi:hypothetical protein
MHKEGTAAEPRHSKPEPQEYSRYLHPPDKDNDFFITFAIPPNQSKEEQDLTAEIVIFDHRAHHQLRPQTREWDEVVKLLMNAVVCLQDRDTRQARSILAEAEQVYYHHNQTRNRIRYLTGALTGIVVAGALGAGFLLLSKSLEQFIARELLILVFVFAGIGSVTSVLTRISSIDLKEETSNFSVIVSGFSRPLVAMFLAVVVYLIMNGHIVDIKLGSATDPRAGYLVVSFLCGFSERFAEDIISRVPFAPQKNRANEGK